MNTVPNISEWNSILILICVFCCCKSSLHLQSGSILAPWSFSYNLDSEREKAFQIGEQVGCSTTDTNELLACMREVEWRDLRTVCLSSSCNSLLRFICICLYVCLCVCWGVYQWAVRKLTNDCLLILVHFHKILAILCHIYPIQMFLIKY